MKSPVFCNDCKWSKSDNDSRWALKCHNPNVNSKDSWALGSAGTGRGTSCHNEREKTWGDFPACGMKGKQFDRKSVEILTIAQKDLNTLTDSLNKWRPTPVICPNCFANRLKEPCPNPGPDCGITGTAQGDV